MSIQEQIKVLTHDVMAKKEILLDDAIKMYLGCSEYGLNDIKDRGEFEIRGDGDDKTTTFVFDGKPLIVFYELIFDKNDDNILTVWFKYKFLIGDDYESNN